MHAKRYVARDFSERADQQTAYGCDFCDAIALAVPGHGRQCQIEFLRQRGRYGAALKAKRCKGSGGTAELQDEYAGAKFVEALAMARDRVKPTRSLEAERKMSRISNRRTRFRVRLAA